MKKNPAKFVLFRGAQDVIEERKVLVGEDFSAVMPKGDGKRAMVVPTSDVFDTRKEAMAASAKGGKLCWVVILDHHPRIRVERARIKLQRSNITQWWRMVIQPVTLSGRTKGEPFEVSTHCVTVYDTATEAYKHAAERIVPETESIQREINEYRGDLKEVQKVRRQIEKAGVKIPKKPKRRRR